MAYWLFKSEPFKFSWEMLKAKGDAGQEWDGVRNYAARNNIPVVASYHALALSLTCGRPSATSVTCRRAA